MVVFPRPGACQQRSPTGRRSSSGNAGSGGPNLTTIFLSDEETVQDPGGTPEVSLGHEQVVPIEGADTSNRNTSLRQGRGDVCKEPHELPIHRHGEANPDQIPLDASVRMPLDDGLQRVLGDQEGGPFLFPDDLGGGASEEREVFHTGSLGESGEGEASGLLSPGGPGEGL